MKIVRAYSGGPNTSVFVSWLKERYNAEIITHAADVGQEEELDGLAEKAKATGASAHYTVGLVEEFARDFIFPMLRGKVSFRKGQVLTVQKPNFKANKAAQ
jgi:argininosuccinate synthase